MLIQNKLILTAGISGFLAVATGAFGSHILKTHISPEMLEIFKTGVFYHLIHSVVILSVGLSGNTKLYKSCIFFIAGIILFSFSLYFYSVTSIKAFAIITPFGGVSFLTGWAVLVYSSLKKDKVQ